MLSQFSQLFLEQTPVQPETFIYQEKGHFNYIRNHAPIVGSDFSICVAQKQGTFDDQDLIIIRGKKISALINDWENNKVLGLGCQCNLFHVYSKQLANSSRGTAIGIFCNLYPHLCVETVFPALNMTQSCYLDNININHK